jgi:hypothetical protein
MNDYNGWTNWETWQILLWATNEMHLYKATTEFIGFYEWPVGYEDDIKFFFYEMFPNGTPDMDSADEMQAVNWSEIAEHLKEWND